MHRCVVFGEYHTPLIRDMIEQKLLEIHKETPFKFILSEEVGPHVYTTKDEMRKAIADKVYSISDCTLKLGIALNVPVVGIDLWDFNYDLPIPEQHHLREQHMLKVIDQYLPIGNVVILVGLAHIRKKAELTDDKTESVVYTYLKDRAEFYRYVDTTLIADDSAHPSTKVEDIDITYETHRKTQSATEALSMATTANPNRKKTEEYILSVVDGADHTGTNGARYRARFEAMSDAEFHKFMTDIRDGIQQLECYAPNMKVNLRISNLIATAKMIGLELFERVRLWDTATKRYMLTPHKHLIALLPVRRMKQYQASKISVPDSDTTTDLLTGQVVRPDKGSSISLVEAQTLLSKNLNMTVTEFLQVRGGDINAYAEMKSQLEETGSASLNSIDPTTRVRSSVVLSAYLNSIHIENNLLES